ncbi:hypothetical protein Hdeb2414_s0004g00149481 [Helianthus debilis subsp. tardiflorus]
MMSGSVRRGNRLTGHYDQTCRQAGGSKVLNGCEVYFKWHFGSTRLGSLQFTLKATQLTGPVSQPTLSLPISDQTCSSSLVL